MMMRDDEGIEAIEVGERTIPYTTYIGYTFNTSDSYISYLNCMEIDSINRRTHYSDLIASSIFGYLHSYQREFE